MLRGFAPDAEIHVIKVFPGGQFSNLLEALDYCVDLDIDIVNLSLGSPQPSEAIEQKLEEAALHGIACVVAAGNSGVQYPASSRYTLAIGAVGRLNEFPETTWDATTVLPNLVAGDGIFSPAFSAFGPEVAVCAPGVAIVSTVPGGFEPQSGTSTAAPHVTGLAALLLAHHPLFQGPLRSRGQQRVAALFGMIRSLCVPYGFGAERVGAGLPRLHGLEQLLQPEPQPGGATTGSHGNGQTTAPPTAASPGIAFRTMGGVTDPMAATVAPIFGMPGFSPREAASAPVAPLYVHPLVAQAWPVQALLESLRRQYLGV
jgi:subtilisin family serine protease